MPQITPESIYESLKRYRRATTTSGRRTTLRTDAVLSSLELWSGENGENGENGDDVARFNAYVEGSLGNLSAQYAGETLRATLIEPLNDHSDSPTAFPAKHDVTSRVRRAHAAISKNEAEKHLSEKTVENRATEALKELSALMAEDHEVQTSRSAGPAGLTSQTAAHILNAVAGDRPVVRDVSISVSLFDSDDEALYERETAASMVGPICSYVVAIVPNYALLDEIIAHCPQVVDVWSTTGLAQHDAVQQIADMDIMTRPINVDGSGAPVHHRLRRISDAAERRRYLSSSLSEATFNQTEVLAAEIAVGDTGDALIRTTSRIRLLKASRCTIWIADRAMLVRNMSFDCLGLTWEGRRPEIRLYPFLANIGSLTKKDRDGTRYDIAIDDWIVKGQGVVLMWS